MHSILQYYYHFTLVFLIPHPLIATVAMPHPLVATVAMPLPQCVYIPTAVDNILINFLALFNVPRRSNSPLEKKSTSPSFSGGYIPVPIDTAMAKFGLEPCITCVCVQEIIVSIIRKKSCIIKELNYPGFKIFRDFKPCLHAGIISHNSTIYIIVTFQEVGGTSTSVSSYFPY